MLFRNDKKDNRESGAASRLPAASATGHYCVSSHGGSALRWTTEVYQSFRRGSSGKKTVFLVTQKDAKVNDPVAEDLYQIGTIGNVVQLLRLPDGTVKVLVEGKKRGRSCVI